MKQYLIEVHHIPTDKILIEDRSANTEQNMIFSKQIMDHHSHGVNYRSIFVTNNFHVFRASIYARKAALDAEGLAQRQHFTMFLMHSHENL